MMEMECENQDTLQQGAPCLHCLIEKVLHHYWMAFGIRDEATGRVGYDVVLTLAKLAEVMANIVVQIDCAAEQDEAVQDIHAMFDGILRAIQTGEEVQITIGGKGKVH